MQSELPSLETSRTDRERSWTSEVNPGNVPPRRSNAHLAEDVGLLKLTTHAQTLQSSLWWNVLGNLILQIAILFTWCPTRSQRAHEKLNGEHKIWMGWSPAHKSPAVLETYFTHNEHWILENRFLPLFPKKVQQFSSLSVKWGTFKDVPGSTKESTSLPPAARESAAH